MIIDFHVHTARLKIATSAVEDLRRKAWGDRVKWMVKTYSSPEAFLGLMDEAGVDYAVILAALAPITVGIADNEYVAEFVQKRAADLIRQHKSLHLHASRRGTRKSGAKLWFSGLKLYPTYQYYYPNDAMMYPLYSKAQELGIPISLHIGSSVFTGARLKYADPIYLDDVAVDFPDLVLLQCHSGRPIWYQKAFSLARFHKNIYMEISGLPPKNLLDYFPELERISHKVIYGSDWPGAPTIKENIQAMRNLQISEESVLKILGKNAASLLGISDSEETM